MPLASIPYMQIRGGTSKGVYFMAEDLPVDEDRRSQILLDALGRDMRQIDGLGGADPLTSKVAIIRPSKLDGIDIDYLFTQVVVGENRVDTTPSCGNILAGVGAFAIDSGLVSAGFQTTKISVNMLNTGKFCEVEVCTPSGEVEYMGDTKIDDVPGTGSAVICNYLDTAGAVCGALYPTGNLVDTIEGIDMTCVDMGMPVVVISADDLGISGYESPTELNADDGLTTRLESIRIQAGPMMNLDDVTDRVVPKMSLISTATKGGLVNTRTFIPHKCHDAVGVLAAVSIATACITKGSVAAKMVDVVPVSQAQYSIEHPTGEFSASLQLKNMGDLPVVEKAGVVRTARLLSRGELYLPA